MKLMRSLIFGWSSPDTLSSLVPGMAWFGGGGGGTTVVSPGRVTPPAAPAPGAASTPTQTVTQILANRQIRKGRASTIMTGENGYAAATTGARRTILGIPIA